MLRTISALAVLAVAVLSGFGIASGKDTTRRRSPVRIAVKPAIGLPTSRFAVSFKAPQRTGRFGSSERRYELTAEGTGGGGCDSSAGASARPARKGARVRVTLQPPPWCPGIYHGRVEELATPLCRQGKACPNYIVRLGIVGRFSFRVQAVQPPGRDATPPSFAGIQGATACTPGPQLPGETTPFNLTWRPATDNITPSAEIVYDIFASATPGGEIFAKPTWTTQPGATTYRTPGLPSHATFYFVVRARDQAGNEDGNTVELRGQDPCV